MEIEKGNKKEIIKLGALSIIILSFVLSFTSCNKDDDETPPTTQPRDRTEQQMTDKDSLLNYLGTHYYNSTHLDTIPNPSTSDLIITELAEGEDVPEGHELLLDGVGNPKTTVFQDTDYEFYLLKINQGGGVKSPTFADRVFLTYEGSLLNGTIFDNAVSPVTFELLALIAGWRKVVPDFNVAESYSVNGDGTITYNNHGAGVMFLPSGLAYFSAVQQTIPPYSPLIFKFDLMDMVQTDHDGDGIPSYLEDINGDGEMTINFENSDDPNDDNTDGDFDPNYQDLDDDGDGILTEDEIEIETVNKATKQEVLDIPLQANQVLVNVIVEENDGTFTGTVITFTDSDTDGVPDYLDAN